jgi:hypothetical protein
VVTGGATGVQARKTLVGVMRMRRRFETAAPGGCTVTPWTAAAGTPAYPSAFAERGVTVTE